MTESFGDGGSYKLIKLKIKLKFKKVVDECLKTMYYIQVAYDRRFLKAKEQYTE